MRVTSNSPAPSSASRSACATASIPVGLRPPWVKTSQPSPTAPRIDRGDDALAAEPLGDLADQFGPRDRGRIDRDLVRARRAAARAHPRPMRTPPPTVSGMKHTSAVRRTTSRIVPRAFMAGGDVEEAELVGPRRVIGLRLLDRIAGVAQVDEVDALDHAPIGDVEAGDDAGADGHAALRHRDRRRRGRAARRTARGR